MKLTYRLLALPALVALLSACGEGSNSLTDPKISEAETTTTCQDKEFCLTGQFVDEPVVGLNYICNLVEGVTDENGLFSCPDNSVATFFLKSATGNRQIILGKYRVRSVGGNRFVRLYVTPEDLLTSADARDGSGTPVQLPNVLRLLQALDSDGNTTNQAINRIVIDPKDKKAIDKLTANVEVLDFSKSTAQFDALLKPMFDELVGKSMATISPQQALERYQASLPTIHSGVYEVALNITALPRNNGSLGYNGMFGRFNNSDLHSMVSMVFVVDREGKAIGNGLEWQNTFTADQLSSLLLPSRLYFSVKPTDVDFLSSDTIFENNGRVKPSYFFNAASGKIKFTQGKLSKGKIASDDFMYRELYGLTATESFDTTQIGKWQRLGLDNSTQLTGSLNLEKSRDTNLYLDSTIWKTIENISVGEKPIFPLHLKLTLRDSDRTAACGGTSGNGCAFGDMGISILANGNIISDRDNNCSVVDATTLQDTTTAMQEQRLGLVSTVLDDDNTKKALPLIAPVILVGSWARQLPSTDPWSKFYGVYMGTEVGSSVLKVRKLQIDISRVLDKIVTMQNQPDDKNSFSLTPVWSNYVKTLQSYNQNLTTTEKDALTPVLSGLVSSVKVQDCYDPQPKQ